MLPGWAAGVWWFGGLRTGATLDWFPGSVEEISLDVSAGVTVGAGVQCVTDSVEDLRYVESFRCYCP